MAIPQDVENKLEEDPSWVVQHEDIVQIMEETPKEKPWSRYMIQQQLDGNPAKKTVKDRLDELVELEILDSYEYRNVTLYDLSYDPVVTDGGSIRDANLLEVATLRDRDSLRDLGAGLLFTSFVFFGYGILTQQTSLPGEIVMTGNFFMDAAIMLYLSFFVVGILLSITGKIDQILSSHNIGR